MYNSEGEKNPWFFFFFFWIQFPDTVTTKNPLIDHSGISRPSSKAALHLTEEEKRKRSLTRGL